MSNIEFVPCVSDELLAQTSVLADEIWHEYFADLLSVEQIDYMVEKFLSFPVMRELSVHGSYGYWQVRVDGILAGFIGLEFQPDRLFLSKLYLRREMRGLHLGSRMLEMVYGQAKSHGYSRVWLTCNKYNAHSLDVYRAKGFVTFDAQVTDIGHGYVMDDYFMEKVLG